MTTYRPDPPPDRHDPEPLPVPDLGDDPVSGPPQFAFHVTASGVVRDADGNPITQPTESATPEENLQ